MVVADRGRGATGRVLCAHGQAWLTLDGDSPVLVQPGDVCIVRGPDPAACGTSRRVGIRRRPGVTAGTLEWARQHAPTAVTRGARPSARRTSRRRARGRVHSRFRRRSPHLRAIRYQRPAEGSVCGRCSCLRGSRASRLTVSRQPEVPVSGSPPMRASNRWLSTTSCGSCLSSAASTMTPCFWRICCR